MRSRLRKYNSIYLSTRALEIGLAKAVHQFNISQHESWLDVGCGTRPYERLFPRGTYIGVDVETSGREDSLKQPDHFYDGSHLPFADESYTGVLCTQVLEHVPDPEALLREMWRVTKPGGGLVLSIPFVYEEHEEPYDFFRFSAFGAAELLRRCGYQIIKMEKDTGSIETIGTLLSVYVGNNWRLPFPYSGRLVVLFLCLPIQLVSFLLQRLFPDGRKLYLNLVISAWKRVE